MKKNESFFAGQTISRRNCLKTGVFAATGLAFNQIASAATPKLKGIRALTFDVYGTSTDHRGTIVREREFLNQSKQLADYLQTA